MLLQTFWPQLHLHLFFKKTSLSSDAGLLLIVKIADLPFSQRYISCVIPPFYADDRKSNLQPFNL